MSGYHKKARLVEDAAVIEQYDRVLSLDKVKEGESHWNSMGKNTLTLLQVLIDQDLTHLVMVLEKYPRFIEAVCEHFRYAYSYSENSADLFAASRLLEMGEPYYTKQFVRNVVRKLPTIEKEALEEIKAMIDFLVEHKEMMHPIILNHYAQSLREILHVTSLHPLQRIVLEKGISQFDVDNVYEYQAADRDAALDIPYMN
ncbi:MAG: hypothetical protein K0U47_03055 [Epsilonproteobacteria bacterium]|nr:hypothetical protein [Campylobacterota bacterium]